MTTAAWCSTTDARSAAVGSKDHATLPVPTVGRPTAFPVQTLETVRTLRVA